MQGGVYDSLCESLYHDQQMQGQMCKLIDRLTDVLGKLSICVKDAGTNV